MQKSPFLFIIILLLVLCSCNFSKGVKKDLTTGLSATYNGFVIDDIFLSTDEGRLNSNTIAIGAKVYVTATGVENFVLKNSNAFPGCTIILTDKTGKEILNLPDAFSYMNEGIPSSEAKTLQGQLNTGDPMIVGETYHLKVRFYDKNKTENELVANVDLKMK